MVKEDVAGPGCYHAIRRQRGISCSIHHTNTLNCRRLLIFNRYIDCQVFIKANNNVPLRLKNTTDSEEIIIFISNYLFYFFY